MGRCYKQEGQDAALRLGHRLVSGDAREARIQAWSAWAEAHPTGALYCFRGGQRSQITQSWLAEAGVELPGVAGGTKPCASTFSTSLTGKAPAFPGA